MPWQCQNFGMSFVLIHPVFNGGFHQNDTLYEPCWLNFATGRHADVVQMKVTWQGETRGHKWIQMVVNRQPQLQTQ